MEDLKKFIINEGSYMRMTEMNADDIMWDSYDEFYKWNEDCLNESPDDLTWLTGLCKRMAIYKVQLMDEESCICMPAYAFYFDWAKNIVIANAR